MAALSGTLGGATEGHAVSTLIEAPIVDDCEAHLECRVREAKEDGWRGVAPFQSMLAAWLSCRGNDHVAWRLQDVTTINSRDPWAS